MKKKCAVFTIVKNEKFFLPIWLNHYKKYFDKSDIYILDHTSTDGSTENLDVNVSLVQNDLCFDHRWLVDTVEYKQKELLAEYECVLFTEVDELVYTTDNELTQVIDQFINTPNLKFQTCTGYEIIQNLETEKSITYNESIIEHRNYWFKNKLYNKTLLSKIPLNWVFGFHYLTNNDVDHSLNLKLCHLHRCDFEMMLIRHEERAFKWKLKDDGSAGFHNRIGDKEGVLKMFNDIGGASIEPIPNEDKKALYGI